MRLPAQKWIRVNRDTGCWDWLLAKDPQGYGRVQRPDSKSRTMLAHRRIWEMLVGPIPPKMTLDHLCRRPSCVRPAHLEPVSLRDNVLRGNNEKVVIWRNGVCPRGHNDWYKRKDRPGQSQCRTCGSDRQRARKRAIA